MKQRPDGRWCKTIRIDGKKVFFYSTASTERIAEKDINSQMIEYQFKQTNHSFKNIAEEWYIDHENTHGTVNTKDAVSGAYNRVVSHFGDMAIENIDPRDISVFIDILVHSGYARKTISNHKSILNNILRYAVVNGYIKYNPVSEIRLPNNLPQTSRELPNDEELRTISQHWDGFDLFGYMLLYTGMRRSEALALEYEDIYDGKIHVNKVARFDGNKLTIVNHTKTKAGEREIILLNSLAEKIPNGNGRIFSCVTSKKRFVTEWKHYTEKYNLTLTPHQLRHAYATMLYETGIDEKAAQTLMGHSDISLTKEIYTHIRNSKMDDVQSKLEKFAW